MARKKTWGGKRPGAGRKPRHGVAGVAKSLRLPPSIWDALDAEARAGESRSAAALRLLARASGTVRRAVKRAAAAGL